MAADHTLVPALGRQRQAKFCDLKASLVYIVGSRLAMATFEIRWRERGRQIEANPVNAREAEG